MGYLAYYLIVFGASYALRYPYLLAAVAVLWLCRRWLPDPYLYFKHAGHVRRLRAEIAHNADNVTARRDLAKIWLTKRRPRRAIVLLEEARRRDRESAELPFLLGKALRALGRFAEAEDAFTRYLAINSSSVEGRVLLACVKRELKDAAGAKAATREALDTFAHVPRFRRRAELKWYLRARLMTVGLA